MAKAAMSNPPAKGAGREEDNILRILIATDNHLGYLEKDERRRDDSFRTMEEILKIATREQVDLLLLAGDLFHENKPTRATLVRTIELFRRYVLTNRPVRFAVVSDQSQNFENRFGLVNYEDPNFNVGLPVFSIHGNHDDPTGAENLSAMDIMAACNLINYFGKCGVSGKNVGEVVIRPILLKKGTSHVALYGLGNIRDERLRHMFETQGQVKWSRPASGTGPNAPEWFNMFVLHQNRVHHVTNKCISERYLAKFLDFVVWGHEHECRVEPEPSSENACDFVITQPGSSVATSLIEGEAKRKHVLLLKVKGLDYQTRNIPLETVRPFEHESIVLADLPELAAPTGGTGTGGGRARDVLSKAVEDKVSRALEEKVEAMIERATAGAKTDDLPLIRLRVDYTGFSTINPQQFGQKFVGKVANPFEILLFSKQKLAPTRGATHGAMPLDGLRPEALDQESIEHLIGDMLGRSAGLSLLEENDLGAALHEFVNKDERSAIQKLVTDTLDKAQKLIQQERNIREEADVEQFFTQEQKAKVSASQSQAAPTPSSNQTQGQARGGGTGPSSAADGGATWQASRSAGDAAAPRKKAATGGSRQSTLDEMLGRSNSGAKANGSGATAPPAPAGSDRDSDLDSLDDDMGEVAGAARKARGAAPASAGGRSGAATSTGGRGVARGGAGLSAPPPKAPARRGVSQAGRSTQFKQTPAASRGKAAKSKAVLVDDDEDEDEDMKEDDGEEDEDEEDGIEESPESQASEVSSGWGSMKK
eukprot:jgi/Mesvir1/29644/Mv21489-RA.3